MEGVYHQEHILAAAPAMKRPACAPAPAPGPPRSPANPAGASVAGRTILPSAYL
jgi:hypothetical protein